MDGLEGGILSNFIRFHLIIAIYNSIMSSHALIASAIAAIVTGTSKLLDSNPSSILFFNRFGPRWRCPAAIPVLWGLD